jgi:hypothetical protein
MKSKLLASKTTARVSIKRRKPGKLPHRRKRNIEYYFFEYKREYMEMKKSVN